MAIYPVCKMQVEDTPFTLKFNDVTYYFCSKGCMDKFKNQHNFVNNHIYELVIIGGGPAGLTAAVYTAIIISTGEGAKAALRVRKYLLEKN